MSSARTLLAVNGTLMRGLELSPNMLAAGAEFVREDRTVPAYRLYSIGDLHPGMVRVASGGVAFLAWVVWLFTPMVMYFGASYFAQATPTACWLTGPRCWNGVRRERQRGCSSWRFSPGG